MPRFTLKVNIFPYISWETSDMCVETLRTMLIFPREIDLRGHMPRFTLEMNIFPSISWETPDKCVLKPSEHCSFFQDNQFEGSHAYVYSINKHFSIYLLGNPINVCWNPQNSARFSEMIALRGHMPIFSWKMIILPAMSLNTPEMYVETLTTVFVFLRQSIWGVTCLGLL